MLRNCNYCLNGPPCALTYRYNRSLAKSNSCIVCLSINRWVLQTNNSKFNFIIPIFQVESIRCNLSTDNSYLAHFKFVGLLFVCSFLLIIQLRKMFTLLSIHTNKTVVRCSLTNLCLRLRYAQSLAVVFPVLFMLITEANLAKLKNVFYTFICLRWTKLLRQISSKDFLNLNFKKVWIPKRIQDLI